MSFNKSARVWLETISRLSCDSRRTEQRKVFPESLVEEERASAAARETFDHVCFSGFVSMPEPSRQLPVGRYSDMVFAEGLDVPFEHGSELQLACRPSLRRERQSSPRYRNLEDVSSIGAMCALPKEARREATKMDLCALVVFFLHWQGIFGRTHIMKPVAARLIAFLGVPSDIPRIGDRTRCQSTSGHRTPRKERARRIAFWHRRNHKFLSSRFSFIRQQAVRNEDGDGPADETAASSSGDVSDAGATIHSFDNLWDSPSMDEMEASSTPRSWAEVGDRFAPPVVDENGDRPTFESFKSNASSGSLTDSEVSTGSLTKLRNRIYKFLATV